MKFLSHLRAPTSAQVAQRQRDEAELNRLEHSAAAEHHAALAAMYAARVKRLDAEASKIVGGQFQVERLPKPSLRQNIARVGAGIPPATTPTQQAA